MLRLSDGAFLKGEMFHMKHLLSLALAVLLLTGCSSTAPPTKSTPPPSPPPEDQSVFVPVQLPEPEPDPRQETIDRLMASMTLEEKVGQLFFPRCPEKAAAKLAAEYHLGGYLLFGRDFKDATGNWRTADLIKQTIQNYQDTSAIPMLIGVDEEGGTVTRVSPNPELREKRFDSPQQLYQQGGLEAILADCREKDELLHELGFNVNFAPVADLSTDPEDYIYKRTLGLGTVETCEYIAAVVAQMEADRMGSVLKHFPGYGSNEDTHNGAALDVRPLDQLRQADFLPFQAGINAASGGTTAVLVSHNTLQEADPDRPSSLSPAVYRILREELGFEGPVLTDELSMKAITKYAKEQDTTPAILALEAGCDMVVTTNFQTEITQVLDALKDGSLSQERVDEALARVLGWKYDLGLISQETLTS